MTVLRATFFLLFLLNVAQAQPIDQLINKNDVQRIEKTLSSDSMKGRKVATPGLEKAAEFISSEFRAAGLQALPGQTGFKQQFELASPRLTGVSGTLNKQPLTEKSVVAITSKPLLHITPQSGYDTASITTGANLFREANRYIRSGKNVLVAVDNSFATSFDRLDQFKSFLFVSDKSVVFVLANAPLTGYDLTIKHEVTTTKLANVVGILPGKGRKNEYVIFSAHYDHLGTGEPVRGDSIFNGANDDASGTTAVISLAKYFKSLGNNERTIVFAAFAAEESGGFGSQYFSRQFDPSSVAAMFNIEMIGTESKWGKNSAYITGFEKTNMGELLQKNLEGSGFTFHPDPYPDQQLFYRSDNATLARLGVPAHTISTSKMDNEKYYHTVDDEIETLDLSNMTMIIKSIALSSRSIINGKDSPSRVDTQALR
jgi:hypothetical protein